MLESEHSDSSSFHIESLLKHEILRSDSGKSRGSIKSLLSRAFLEGESFEHQDDLNYKSPVIPSRLEHVANSKFLTVFLLLNTMIGSGILNQPQVFQQAGVVSASIMLIVAAFFIWLGLVTLIDCGVAHSKFDYSELAFHAFGKWGEVLVDFSIAIGNFGALMSYVVVIGGTANDLLLSWGCSEKQYGCSEYVLAPLIIALFVAPICLKRVFGELALLSVVSMFSISSIVLLTVIGGPIVGNGGPIVLNRTQGLATQLGSIIFALSCAFAGLHTYISLKDADTKRWRIVVGYAMILGTLMLFVIGIAGYLSFRQNTNGIILSNFVGSYADLFKIMLILHLILYIPVEFVTMRYSIVKLAGQPLGQVPGWLGHSVLTIGLLGITVLVVLLLYWHGLSSGQAFGLILDLSGGLAGSITSFVMPGAFYVKLMPKTAPLYYPSWVMLVLGIIMAIVIPIYSVIDEG